MTFSRDNAELRGLELTLDFAVVCYHVLNHRQHSLVYTNCTTHLLFIAQVPLFVLFTAASPFS